MRYIPKNITKDLLNKLYIEENKSYLQIGKEINKSNAQISRYLKRFGIKARPFSTKGMVGWAKGITLSFKTRKKISKAHMGKKIPIEVRMKMGSKGSKNPAYIDGRTPQNKLIRQSIKYKLWKADVFERDNYTCQDCGQRGGELHAHHIKPFAQFPDLRFSLGNGRTLCKNCHRKTFIYGKRN